jgi:hypothetical protein
MSLGLNRSGRWPGRLLHKLWRRVDLFCVLSARARAAHGAGRIAGISPAVMYDGGLELRAGDLVSLFHQGMPPVDVSGDTLFVVASVITPDGALKLSRARYLPQTDHWQDENETWLRDDALEYWVLHVQYPAMFAEAVRRGQVFRAA